MNIGKEDLTKFHSLTVGRLREFLNNNNLSDEAKVLVEIDNNESGFYCEKRVLHPIAVNEEIFMKYQLVHGINDYK